MKILASSIIVFSGAILLATGAFVRHGDTKTFVMSVGFTIGLMGMAGWFAGIKDQSGFRKTASRP